MTTGEKKRRVEKEKMERRLDYEQRKWRTKKKRRKEKKDVKMSEEPTERRRRTEGADDTAMTRCCPIGPSEAPQVSPEHDLC